MKKNNITTSIGTINLNNIEFCEDTIDVFISIESVSKDIQGKINEAVEIAKKEYRWSTRETKNELSLWVHIKDKEFSYCISVDIIDSDNDDFTSASVDVDLLEYQNELKKVVVKAMIDNFFD